MQVSSEWVASVNYWLRRVRMMDSGSFQLEMPPPVCIPPRLGLFELKTNLAPGGTADAYFRLCTDNTNWVTDTTPKVFDSGGTLVAITTKLVDINGNLRAFGRDSTGTSAGRHGSYAIAWHDDFLGSDTQVTDKWNIASCQEQEQLIMVGCSGCSATPSIAASATFTGTGLVVLDRGQDPTFGSGSMASIHNYNAPIQAAGGSVAGGIVCAWDENAGYYIVIDGPC